MRLKVVAAIAATAAAMAFLPSVVGRHGALDEAAQAAGLSDVPAGCSPVGLPTLGGRFGNVVALSSNGLAAGIADDGAGISRPVLWRNGKATAILTDLSGAVAVGVNSRGQVIGTGYDTEAQVPVGWSWMGGKMTRLRVPSGYIAVPDAISDTGTVVGALVDDEEHADGPGADDVEHAALWSSSGAEPTVLQPLKGDNAGHAFAVNSSGVVGGVSAGDRFTPVIWDDGGRPHAMQTLGGDAGVVSAVDPDGRAYGASSLASGGQHATAWDTNGRAHDLGVMPGGRSSRVAAAAGQQMVVGDSSAPAGGGSRGQAVLWVGPSGPRHLTPLAVAGFGGVAATANGVSQGGLVGGYSSDATGSRIPTLWRCR